MVTVWSLGQVQGHFAILPVGSQILLLALIYGINMFKEA